ncbi:MAG: deoxyhypusine synthase family protein [Synechococcaceae cyanobacterium]|nr:deoxyhypusine synthase family protein [Synechococcaceae cyanobacterium]
MSPGPVSRFIDRHYQHFNAAALKDAANAYAAHVDAGGQMLLTLAGAMSTAELSLSLAEMIRREKVHAIVCTGANLEEDLFNLVAHNDYERIPNYRDLTAADDAALLHRNRIVSPIPASLNMRRCVVSRRLFWRGGGWPTTGVNSASPMSFYGEHLSSRR